MKLTQNTILITGGGSGIGRSLAESFHALGNRIIIAGRGKQKLEETASGNPSMEFRILDQDKADDIQRFAAELVRDFPGLNAVVNHAGIQRMEDLTSGQVTDAEATVTTKKLVGMGFLKVIATDLLAGNLGRDSQHRHPTAVAIVEAIDQVHVARPATSSANRQFAR
jgi:uncharacterized oxidoreductase